MLYDELLHWFVVVPLLAFSFDELDLLLCSGTLVKSDVNMDEITLDRLQELLDASSVAIKNTKEKKSYLI